MSKQGPKSKLRQKRKKQARWHATTERVLLEEITLTSSTGCAFAKAWLANDPQFRYFRRKTLRHIYDNRFIP